MEMGIAARESTALAALANRARDYAEESKAPNTRRAYRSDWRDFEQWGRAMGRETLPAEPETIALYLTARAETLRVGSLQRRLAAISVAHGVRGLDNPTRSSLVRSIMAGIRRAHGAASHGVAPLLVEDIRTLAANLPETPLGTRDKALLLLGFAGAFRRSELVALNVGDMVRVPEGLEVTLRRGKTDQEGRGRKIGVPRCPGSPSCPVAAVGAWIEARGSETGPLFVRLNKHGHLLREKDSGGPLCNNTPYLRLSDRAVARIVQRGAEIAGLTGWFAGHSLRAGLATSAAMAGASERSIMAQTGHRSVTIARRYIRDGSLFRENAAGIVGL